MQTAALARARASRGEWTLRGDRGRARGFDGAGRARCAGDGFAGANVTVPHKLAALALADAASDAARAIGAANTLSFADGRIAAENTDAAGDRGALPDPRGRQRALVLGAGGSARAAIWALARGRGGGRGLEPHRARRPSARRASSGVVADPTRTADLPLERFDLIVNATTVGLEAANRCPAEASRT